MSTDPFTVPHAVLLLLLHLSAGQKTENELEFATGLPVGSLQAALGDLRRKGLVENHAPEDGHSAKKWFLNAPLDEEFQENLSDILCASCPEDSVLYQIGLLAGATTLEDCEHVIQFLDGHLKDNHPATFSCFELTVHTLLDWGEKHLDDAGQKSWHYAELVLVVQSMCIFSHHFLPVAAELSPLAHELASRNGSERFMPMIRIFRNYLQIFLDDEHPLPPTLFQQAEKLRDFDESDVQDRIPVFQGIQFFLEGQFKKTLECYARRPSHNHWWYKRFFEPLSFCASQAAMYLREYPLATGIIESARRTAELAGEKSVAMLWLSHLTFILLRKGDLEEALQHIDTILSCVSPEMNYKVFSSALRGLALYHHLSGHTDAAYRVLYGETCRAIRRNVPHSPFLDPLVLDLLYVFEQRGYPPIPRYELDPTIATLLQQTNAQLRGAAMRVQALRLRSRGEKPWKVSALLQQSLVQLEQTNDLRELVLSHHELANILDVLGERKDAAYQRSLLARRLGTSIDENTSYRRAAILATSCAFFPALGDATQKRELGRELLDRFHTAFNQPPLLMHRQELFQRILDVAQLELQSERAALFRPVSGNRPECIVSVNLTPMELESPAMSENMAWIMTVARTASTIKSEKRRLCMRLDVGDDYPWLLYMDSRFTQGTFQNLAADILHEVARLLAAEVRSCLRLDRVQIEEKNRHQEQLTALSSPQDGFSPIIGEGLKKVMRQCEQVGSTDVAVLILGETGVGKEIIARHLHQISGRTGPFIAVHPASLPESLFESEFFGYEKGAFTGAVRQKIGLFELADQGTLFIDEIGEMPLLIQTKLLRVLQDQHFMRLGGTQELVSHFRLIAATNRDLWKEVRGHNFREDLLYRISVIPLSIPPLRDRKQDIPGLIQYFIDHYSCKYNKRRLSLSSEQWEKMLAYDWPGNVRELRNIIERAVILELADYLDVVEKNHIHASQTQAAETFSPETLAEPLTLSEVEERYLRHVMQMTGGRVRGPNGAETLLKMKRSTLYAKLKKYAIS